MHATSHMHVTSLCKTACTSKIARVMLHMCNLKKKILWIIGYRCGINRNYFVIFVKSCPILTCFYWFGEISFEDNVIDVFLILFELTYRHIVLYFCYFRSTLK